MAEKREAAINSYITDMLALEEHISKAIKAQAEDFGDDHPAVGRHLTEMHEVIGRHIHELDALADTKSGNAVGDAIKQAGSVVAGWGAAAIDLVRNEKLPKNLRDDYTAFSLASIGYLMLYTTASALESEDTASLAARHLADYASMLNTLLQLIPDTVVEFLREDGFSPRPDVLYGIHRGLTEAWRGHAAAAH